MCALALQYYSKHRSCPFNPANNCTFNPKYKQHFERKEKSIKPFGLRMKSTLQASKISLNNIHESKMPQTPPWIIKKTRSDLRTEWTHQNKTYPSTYQKFRNILQLHSDHQYIFTDDFKDNDKMAYAAVLNKTIIKKALPTESSIFTKKKNLRTLLSLNCWVD